MNTLNKYILESLFGQDSIDDQIDSNYWEAINKSVKSELYSFIFNFEFDIKDKELNIYLFKGAEIEINNEFINFIKKYNEIFKKINIYKDPKLNNTISYKLNIITQIPSIYEDTINDLLNNLTFYKINIKQDPKIKLNLKICFLNPSNLTLNFSSNISNKLNITYVDTVINIADRSFFFYGTYENFKNLEINFTSTKDKNKFKKIVKGIHIYDDSLFAEIDKLFKNKEKYKLYKLLNDKFYKYLPKPNPDKDFITVSCESVSDDKSYTIGVNLYGRYVVDYEDYHNYGMESIIL